MYGIFRIPANRSLICNNANFLAGMKLVTTTYQQKSIIFSTTPLSHLFTTSDILKEQQHSMLWPLNVQNTTKRFG